MHKINENLRQQIRVFQIGFLVGTYVCVYSRHAPKTLQRQFAFEMKNSNLQRAAAEVV